MKKLTWCLTLFMLIGLVALGPGITSRPALAGPPRQGAVTVPAIWQVIEQTNRERAAYGLPPLGYNSRLSQAAQAHSQAMATQGFFDHTNPLTHTTQEDRITQAGYEWFWNAENIFAGNSDPLVAVQHWMDSPGHRANILNSNPREIGVGYAHNDADPLNYFDFWTQVFGSRANYFPVVIEGEAYFAPGPTVSLYIYGQEQGAVQMRLAVDGAPLEAWQPFQSTTSITLPNTAGEHRVAVEIQTAGGQIYSAADSIILLESGAALPTSTPNATETQTGFVSTPAAPGTGGGLADDDAALGPADAPVTIVSFSDYQCYYCGQFALNVIPPLLQAYPTQVSYIQRDFPIFGPLSEQAAQAAECAEEQGRFYDYGHLLYQQQGMYSDTSALVTFAGQLGLDTVQFETCLNNGRYASEVAKDQSDGAALGISGVPTFFINGRRIDGAVDYATLVTLVEQALAEAVSPALATLPPTVQVGVPSPTPWPTWTPAPMNTVQPPTAVVMQPTLPVVLVTPLMVTAVPTAPTAAPTRAPEAAETTFVKATSLDRARCWPWRWIVPLLMLLLILLFLALHYRLAHELWNWPPWARLLCKLIRTALLIYLLFFGYVAGLMAGGLCKQCGTLIWRVGSQRVGEIVSLPYTNSSQSNTLPGTQSDTCQGCHVYHPDTDRMVFTRDRLSGPVYLWERKSKSARALGFNSSYVAFAPNGQRLAVALNDSDIYLYDFASDQLTAVEGAASPDYVETMPTWSADGQQIIFARSENPATSTILLYSPTDLYSISAVGGTAEPVPGAATPGVFEYFPSYAPHQPWLAFTRHMNADVYADPAAEVWLLPLNGSTSARQVAGPGASWPVWSADGQWLAYGSTRQDEAGDVFATRVLADGTLGGSLALKGANLPGVFERLPAVWTIQPPLSLKDLLLGLLPWLLPLLPWLILIKLGCSRPAPEEEPGDEPEPQPKREPLLPLTLPPWERLDVLWEPQPALVVGLGRTGHWTLLHLKKNLWDAGLGELPPQVPLLCVDTGDTAPLQPDGTRRKLEFGGVSLDDAEIVEWRDNLRSLVQGAAQDEALRGWVDPAYLDALGRAGQDPSLGLRDQRTLGRLALIGNLRGQSQDTRVQVWERLTELAGRAADQNRLTVVLVANLGEAVGSGSFLDTAYLLRKVGEVLDLHVRIIGHLATDRIEGRRTPFQQQVNTAAAVRELERFQLAGTTSFPMHYAPRLGESTPYDGQVNTLLFDELYLYDGESKPHLLNNVEPQYGILPAIADSIALWLDKAARTGSLAQRRDALLAEATNQQIYRGELIVSSLGIRQFCLPFADLLETITVRYARQALQHLLMGTSEDRPTLDAAYALERFIDRAETPRDLALAFLDQKLGPPDHLDKDWLKMIHALRHNDRERIEAGIQKLPTGETVQASWESWLSGIVMLLLNGQQVPSNVEPDYVVKRGAKVSLVSSFLEELAGEEGKGGILGAWARRVHELASDREYSTGAADQIADFAAYAGTLRKNLLAVAGGLGLLGGPSLFRDLEQDAARLEKRYDELSRLVTRHYIWENADHEPLSDVWYAPLSQQLNVTLRQMYWRIEGDQPVLALNLPGAQDEVFDPEHWETFQAALLKFGHYVAQSVREENSLLSVLRENQLHSDQQRQTILDLWTEAGPALGYQEAETRGAIDSSILSLPPQLWDNTALGEIIRQQLITPDNLLTFKTTNPFNLAVVHAADIVPISTVPSLKRAFENYAQEMGLVDRRYDERAGMRSAAFEAEALALTYERRLPELRRAAGRLSPLAVSLLAQPVKTQVYLLAAASGQELTLGRTVVFNAREWPDKTLLNSSEVEKSPRGALLEGLMKFHAQIEETQARQILQRYDREGAYLTQWDQWEQDGWQAWLQADLTEQARRTIQDLIDIARLLIRDMLGLSGDEGES